jgi:hypothetical protein
MSDVNGVQVPFAAYPADDPGMSGLTPDSMIAYCASQLDDIDTQIATDIDHQKLEIRERAAVNQVKTSLEKHAPNGPQSGPEMQECVDAYDQAIATLPPHDPVALELRSRETAMETKYGFHPATHGTGTAYGFHPAPHGKGTAADGIPVEYPVEAKLDTKPSSADWQGHLDDLGNFADTIKSNAEIELLQLNSLVSQRQEAVQLATGMVGKLDDTLESEVRAIGQG